MNLWMKKMAATVITAIICCGVFLATANNAPAQDTTTVPTVEERLKDLEAYVTNSAPAHLKSSGPGHNAWLMTSAALVLFMTLPGLALFYGGLVRSKNVLSIMAQCLSIACMVAMMWWAFGYSLVFGTNFKGTGLGMIFGGSEFFFFNNVDSLPNTDYSFWVSHNIWAMYQMMFAIITPALIIGAIAERMKFSAIILFTVIWMLVVYFPIAHLIWGSTGWMNGLANANATVKSIDFAGGIVVHMTSGWSALVLCLILGPRMGYGKIPMAPHSLVLCMVGTGMLWVGWYGFNAGSAAASDGIAANAFTTTTLAAAAAAFTWGMIEYIFKGKASVLGLCSGAVAGLATITPACGFVSPNSAIIIGVAAGIVPYFACTKIKQIFGYDDALDTFGVHAVGGTLGSLFAGIFASVKLNPNLATNLHDYVGLNLYVEQLKAMGITLALSIVATVAITLVVKSVLGGLRPAVEKEEAGLDIHDHNEQGYVHE